MSRIWPLLCAPLLGLGCLPFGSGFSLDRDRSCSEDFLEWDGGLTHHLLEGRRNGTFDYDPPDGLRTGIVGTYDLDTGDFDWSVSFHPDHYRVETLVEGYGYAMTNGDLDIEMTVTTTDILGETATHAVREERVGCEVERTSLREDGTLTLHEGVYTDGVYEYTETVPSDDGPTAQVEGVRRPDQTATEHMSWSGMGESYEHEQDRDADGHIVRDWEHEFQNNHDIGVTEIHIDGTIVIEFTRNGTDEVAYTVDYEGNGEGTYEDCDIECIEWDCQVHC